MLEKIQGPLRFKEQMSMHTLLRIGGPADIFIQPLHVDDVRYALTIAKRENLPVFLVGGGSNLLVKDKGIRGIVLKLAGCLARANFEGNEVIVGAGVELSALIRDAAAHDLGGLEPLAGIPGTIGGALATNAGTDGIYIGDVIGEMYFLKQDGTIGQYAPTCACKYDPWSLPSGTIIVGCRIPLRRKNAAAIQKDIEARVKLLKRDYPLATAAAGPVWKNPSGDDAGRLIEKVGLKGRRLNGAEISVKNPNFIINRSSAAAADVLALMELARERVQTRFGIMLEQEIRIIGE